MLGIYLVGSWIALQVVDVLGNMVTLPEWFPGFAVALLVIGLPIVLATAFVQVGVPSAMSQELEGAAGGPRTGPGESTAATATGFFTWRNAILGGLAAFALLGVVTAGWWVVEGRTPPAPGVSEAAAADTADLRSVAVLPFVTRSAEESDLYFADGMHDDLLTQLSKVEALTVISRTSVQKYRDVEMSIPAIAQELGVATILEGGIQRAGARVRVNVQLIEAATDRHLWAETYDEELTAENLFHIQSDLAQKIAGALQATLTPDVAERLNVQQTTSLEAFDAYSRGRYLYERSLSPDGAGLREALALFQQAVALDSTYAMAWAGIADAYTYGAGKPLAFTQEEGLAKAWPAVERALELDSNLAEAYARRGDLQMIAGRMDAAEADFGRALDLAPGSSLVISRYGGFLSRTGRLDEAVANARRNVERNPTDVNIRAAFEDLLWQKGAFEEGQRVAERTVAMEPAALTSWYNVGWFAGMNGDPEKAIDAFSKCLELSSDEATYRSALAWAYALAGDRESALAETAKVPVGSPSWDMANVYFILGDEDRAFAVLEAVFKANPTLAGATGIDVDWSTASMRADPRYRQLLTNLGLDG